jgi:hypothetical protein
MDYSWAKAGTPGICATAVVVVIIISFAGVTFDSVEDPAGDVDVSTSTLCGEIPGDPVAFGRWAGKCE